MIDLGEVPLAGGFLDSPGAIESEKRYPLEVHVCEGCSLVQITDPIDPAILFQDYSFSASTVPGLVKHFNDYAEWLKRNYAPKTVVEFGSNDGVLLGPLGERGIRAIGIDISENITELARSRGFDSYTGAFTPTLASEILDRVDPIDLVTGSNVFAHNARPDVILEAATTLLKDDGLLCLEVMYAGDLLKDSQWDTLYHEHLTFYSLGTLSNLLRRSGFYVIHAEQLPMHGGSLRVVASRSSLAVADSSIKQIESLEAEMRLNDPATWSDFGSRSRRTIAVVADTFGRLAGNSEIWAYGAAGKATMWVNMCAMNYLVGVVDASPLRAGKLMPGTHTPIVFPETFRDAAPDFVFVTAWNYLDAIRRSEAEYRGVWAVPLPELRFS